MRRLWLIVFLALLAFPCLAAESTPTDSSSLQAKAEQGDAIAQYKLGCLYFWGLGGIGGTKPSKTEALKWIRKAADKGLAIAQSRVGSFYIADEATKKTLHIDFPHDFNQAAVLFRKAAEQGDADAQYQLGKLYVDGHGVPKNYEEAYFWLTLAISADEKEASWRDHARDDIEARLTSAQVSAIQKRAKEWKPSPTPATAKLGTP